MEKTRNTCKNQILHKQKQKETNTQQLFSDATKAHQTIKIHTKKQKIKTNFSF